MSHLRIGGRENIYRRRRVAVSIPVAKLLAFPAIGRNVLMRDRNRMVAVEDAAGIRCIDDAAPPNTPRPDWCIVREAILESIATSPDAFLATAGQLKKEPPEYWQGRLESSTWAVVQRGGDVLGIAAAKPPSEVDVYALEERACFIESVWIDPSIRGSGVGERLVTYLMEQRRREAGIQKFYLWVFDYNAPAIRLYERMKFEATRRPSELREIQFLREFDSDLIDNLELEQNADARTRDRVQFGITYRLLTPLSGQ